MFRFLLYFKTPTRIAIATRHPSALPSVSEPRFPPLKPWPCDTPKCFSFGLRFSNYKHQSPETVFPALRVRDIDSKATQFKNLPRAGSKSHLHSLAVNFVAACQESQDPPQVVSSQHPRASLFLGAGDPRHRTRCK